MKVKDGRLRRFFAWLSGSIRRKLTLFVILVSLLLVGLVWLLLVQLLEPAYNYSIRRDLEGSAGAMLAFLEQADDEGLLVEEYYRFMGVDSTYYSMTSAYSLLDYINGGYLKVSSRSIDVADSSLACRLWFDTLDDSILHPRSTNLFTSDERSINSTFMLELRAYVREQGSVYLLTNSGNQMIVGRLSDDGRHTVIVSANLERTSQSVMVLRALLIPVSAVLVLVAVLCAWIFSRWFTSPIRRLSTAAQEMARGNYDIRVKEEGRDEIATLARDFNLMATEVQRSASMQRDLIANVSHDLRTPLTLIKGYAETVRDLTGDDKPKRNEQLDVIVDEADRLSSLVGRVMELSRVSSGNEKPEPLVFDIAQLCDEVGYRYAEYCGQNGLQFDFVCGPPSPVLADPALLERVLHNLLGNALNHAGPDGYISLRVHSPAPGKVRVEVADHGPGIPPEDLPYIFDRYYRSRADSGKPGTGLGLSITKAILQAQNLDYGVVSEVGQGSVFWFELPLAAGPTQQ